MVVSGGGGQGSDGSRVTAASSYTAERRMWEGRPDVSYKYGRKKQR